MWLRRLLSNFYDPEYVSFFQSNGDQNKLHQLVDRIHSTSHLEYLNKEKIVTEDSKRISQKVNYLQKFDNLYLSASSATFIRDMFYKYGVFPLISSNISLKRDYSRFEEAYNITSKFNYDYSIKIRNGDIIAMAINLELTLPSSIINLNKLKLLIVPVFKIATEYLFKLSNMKILTTNSEVDNLKYNPTLKIINVDSEEIKYESNVAVLV